MINGRELVLTTIGIRDCLAKVRMHKYRAHNAELTNDLRNDAEYLVTYPRMITWELTTLGTTSVGGLGMTAVDDLMFKRRRIAIDRGWFEVYVFWGWNRETLRRVNYIISLKPGSSLNVQITLTRVKHTRVQCTIWEKWNFWRTRDTHVHVPPEHSV